MIVRRTSIASSKWHNWAQNVECEPGLVLAPAGEAQLRATLARARDSGIKVRPRGSGHSFVPLCATDGVSIAPDRLVGIAGFDPETASAKILSGTVIAELGEPLGRLGVALPNQGDIDVQTIAGAIATGTHGTGRRLGNLSTQLRSLTLMLASGERVEIGPSETPDLFAAAGVSLGCLGVILDVTLELTAKYKLKEDNWALSVEDCCASFPRIQDEARNIEFFWLPKADLCVVKRLEIASGEPAPGTDSGELLAPPGTVERYLRASRTDWSHLIYPSTRTVPFKEMEFAVPLECGIDCFRALRQLMLSRFPATSWAVEYRTVCADGFLLSQASGRDVACISVHEEAASNHEPLFRAAQELFLGFGGRPHWGKIHYCDARILRGLYPRWAEFLEIREQLDPCGLFLNPYLQSLLETEG